MAFKTKRNRLVGSVLAAAAALGLAAVLTAAQVEASESVAPAGRPNAASVHAHLRRGPVAAADGRSPGATDLEASSPLADPGARPPGPAGATDVPDDPDGAVGQSRLPLAVREGLQPLLPPAVPGWDISAVPLRWQGLDRYYLVARPVGDTGSRLPLLVVLHGHGMLPASMEPVTHFLQTVGRAVVVYPAGYWASWDAGYCCGEAARAGVDDVGFIEAVVRQVRDAGPRRLAGPTFVVGYSNGGRMAYRLACQDPGAFAGVAAVEAVPVFSCPGTRPVSLLVIASTGDPLITVSDNLPPKRIRGHVEMTVEDAVSTWRQLDGCTGRPQAANAGLFAVQRWQCGAGATLELAVRPGGSHAWFQGSPGTPSDQSLVWSFFSSAGRG